MTRRRFTLFCICAVLLAALCAVSFLHSAFFSSAPAQAADGVEWRATGKARISRDDAQGVLLARRAALTDARRNLLLSYGYEAGRVGPHQIASEWRDGKIYYVEVVARETD